MSFSFKKFDASQVSPMSDRVLLPAGYYTFIIHKPEWVTTKAKDGKFLKLELMVVDDGDYEQENLIVRLNLDNPNPKAVAIAERELATIYNALGVTEIEDESELCDKPFVGKVAIKPAQGDFGESNELKGYYHLDNDPRGVDGSPIVPKEEKKADASGPKKMAWQK